MTSTDITAELDALRAAYETSHAEQERTAARPSTTLLNTCRYCGRFWRKWSGSMLDGHAQCMVGDDFRARLAELLRSPHITLPVAAKALGVTTSVIRAWWVAAQKGKAA